MRLGKAIIGLLLFCVVMTVRAEVVRVTGAGSSFIYPVLSQWAAAYKDATKIQINYQPIGSGGGLRQLYSHTVDFAASDMPLKPGELAHKGLTQFPGIIGGIVPIVNLPGVHKNQLVLSGPVLAEIYSGKIKYWDDAAIKQLNPKLQLPHKTIISVHRSDGSGTTFSFTNYLAKVSPAWRKEVGSDTVVSWPGFGLGAKGNAGVASQVQQLPDSIGYVEYAYAAENHLVAARLRNKAGKIVHASQQAFAAAARHADWQHAKSFYLILTNQPGDDSWPIVATTYVLLPTHPKDAKAALQSLKFFRWAYQNGRSMANRLSYVSLPTDVVKLIEANWRQRLAYYQS